MKKSVISLLLALIIILSSLSVLSITAFAAESQGFTYTKSDNGLVITGYTGEKTDTLTIPATLDGQAVYSIGNEAFMYKAFKTVIISEGIKVLEDACFQYCQSLSSISLPDSLVKLSTYSLSACPSLAEITIPKNVDDINFYAFQTNYFVNIEVDIDNKFFKSVDGVLYTKDGKALRCYPSYHHARSSYTVLEGTEEIGAVAFMSGKIKEIILPASLKKIKAFAFSGCTNLTSIVFKAAPELIGRYAFSGCDALTKLTIPEGCTQINECFVKGCKNLRILVIPSTVTSLDGHPDTADNAFSGANKELTVYTTEDGFVAEAARNAGLKVLLLGDPAADAVVDQIDSLGTVTLKSEAAVASARAAYDALSSSRKELVINYDILVKAEKTLDSLKAQVNSVIKKIDALGKITLDSADDITVARSSYNKLSKDNREFVTNYDSLLTAESAFTKLMQPINDVIAAIDSLGSINSLDKKPKVEAVRAAYDALGKQEQSLVTNYDDLLFAESIISGLENGVLLGDLNNDGKYTVSDILSLKNLIMSGTFPTDEVMAVADVKMDGKLTVSDILGLKELIMSA